METGEIDEDMDKSGPEEEQEPQVPPLLPAILLLVPAFPVIPAFVLGILLGKTRLLRRVGETPLWVALLVLSFGWPAYIWFADSVMPGSSRWVVYAIFAPFVLSGLPAGMLFEKRTEGKWLGAVPIFVVSLSLWSYFQFFMLPGGPGGS